MVKLQQVEGSDHWLWTCRQCRVCN